MGTCETCKHWLGRASIGICRALTVGPDGLCGTTIAPHLGRAPFPPSELFRHPITDCQFGCNRHEPHYKPQGLANAPKLEGSPASDAVTAIRETP